MKGRAPLVGRGLRRFDALARRSPLLLAMDLDGTLAPIVAMPSRARIPAKLGRLLRSLGRMDGVSLAVISGRSLADLQRRCRLRAATLVGAHGLSSAQKGLGMSSVQKRRWSGVLREARRRLAPLHLLQRGVRVEDKGLGLTLHLGRVPVSARRSLPALLAAALRGLPLELQAGLRVLELRPQGAWGKGLALRRWAELREPGWRRKGACLFAGDDVTDEDAFKALRRMGSRALGLKIGPGMTQAHCRVKSPAQFWWLLRRIEALRSSR